MGASHSSARTCRGLLRLIAAAFAVALLTASPATAQMMGAEAKWMLQPGVSTAASGETTLAAGGTYLPYPDLDFPPRVTPAAALALGPSGSEGASRQAEPKWMLQVGISTLTLRDKMELEVGGSPVPNAGIDTKTHATASATIARFVAPKVAIAATVGIPPTIKARGAKALEPYGLLAKTTYGPTALMAQYHFNPKGKVQPYLGAGACYMIIFDADDGAFQDVKLENDLAPAVQAGVNFMLKPKAGVFLDVKKSFLRTTARGNFGGTPVEGRVALDPWVVSAGVVLRF